VVIDTPAGRNVATISDQLRAAVEARIKAGWTVYRVAKEAGVTPAMLSRFLNQGLDLRLSTAAKLAAVLGLELRPAKKKNT
jgi:transcriptional regulator with XRE-family HTH domain